MLERRSFPQSKSAPNRGVFFATYRTLYVSGLLLFVLSWILPNHYVPWISFHNEAATFASLAALLLAWIGRGKIYSVGKVWLLPLLLLPLIALQILEGKVAYFGDAWISALYIVGFSASFWLGSQNSLDFTWSNTAIRAFAAAMVAAGVISSWLALHQWLGVERIVGFNAIQDLSPGGRPFGNLGQPNHFATLLMMTLPMVVVLFIQRSLKSWQIVCIVATLTTGLAIAGSRASIAAAVLWVVFFLAFAWQHWGGRGLAILLGWLASFVLGVAGINHLNSYLLLASGGRSFQGMASDSPRITLWSQFLASIKEAPWAGYGWHQSAAAQKIGAISFPADLPTDYAHNVLLDLAAWVGVPVAIVIFGAVSMYLFDQLRRIRTPTQCLCIASSIPFLFQCLVEFPFAYAYFLFPFAWLMGYAQERADHPTEGGGAVEAGHAPSQTAYVVTLAYVAGLAFTWQEYIRAEEEYRVMRFEIRNVGKVPVDHQTPHLILLTQLNALLKYGRWEPSYNMTVAELDGLRAANRSIHWATLQTKLVVALTINGHVEEATKEMRTLEAVFGAATLRQSERVLATYKTRFPELRQLLDNTR